MTNFLYHSRQELRHRLKDAKNYFSIRRRFAGNSRAADLKVIFQTVFTPQKRILFFPDHPDKNSAVYKLCALLGHAITANPRRRFDIAVKWRDATVFDAAILEKIPRAGRIINGRSLDISKRTVAKTFAGIFGYPLEINPREFCGKIVEKSDRNASHDGRLLDGPLAPEKIRPGYVYQKAIDNVFGDLVLDYRISILGAEIPLVYLKYRPVESRFRSENVYVKLDKPSRVFSSGELGKIILMARAMGVDYAEIDILRDKDRRIYVVDVNNTPHGPPDVLPTAEGKIALARLAKAFTRLLEQ